MAQKKHWFNMQYTAAKASIMRLDSIFEGIWINFLPFGCFARKYHRFNTMPDASQAVFLNCAKKPLFKNALYCCPSTNNAIEQHFWRYSTTTKLNFGAPFVMCLFAGKRIYKPNLLLDALLNACCAERIRSAQRIPWSERNFQIHIWKQNVDSKFKFKI